MSPLNQQIRIGATYTRSINLPRDSENVELVRAYLPTSRALQALTQMAEGLGQDAGSRALALIGPYGSGKSAFGLFLAALLSAETSPAHQAAITTLQAIQPSLATRFQQALVGQRGFLRIQINGIPDSLVRQLMLTLAAAVQQNGLSQALVDDIYAAAHPGFPMDRLLSLMGRVQSAWAAVEGTGVLLEIDELGKFLEYESYHPQHREIHLLQLLAEQAYQVNSVPLHLVVMLHQAFEYYSHRLGKHLRDEWQKVQGRFGAIAFLEPAEQSLRIVAAAFESSDSLTPVVQRQLDKWTACLAKDGALPLGLDEAKARELFERCYPLHPLTLLILPVLCQKVAQNERTLFSYLGSNEPFGLQERLGQLQMGDWIEPWELYDYFILNQGGGFSDPLTYHRWVEVITALERFDGKPDEAAVRLLKTIGLLNLIGGQRGLKASQPILQSLFGSALPKLIERLETDSIIHLRHYNREYRVWQGSDFDLRGALQQAIAEQINLPLVDTLNRISPLKPVVARRATIVTGTLRCFIPEFTDRDRWPPKEGEEGDPKIWFYLAGEEEPLHLKNYPSHSVVAICRFTERLREAIIEWMALQELPKHHATLHHDPVAQREHRVWLSNTETETVQLVRTLLEEPESLRWFWEGKKRKVRNRRDLQEQLSDWIKRHRYRKAPLIKNELINWERPSASANTGRKRLLIAMLGAADQENLGIAKTPAEKSLYLSLLKETGLHRKEGDHFGFYPPPAADPCRLQPMWDAISRVLGDAGERQIGLAEVYATLQRPPYGVKLGVLPVLLVAYLLAHRREVALYQEGSFCETLTIEHAELLCRRPALFALERFDLAGLRGELFERYISSVVGNVQQDATLLDIVRPLVRFVSSLPEYTMHCNGLSPEAERVREAFLQAKSPGVLLFDALPQACGVTPAAIATGEVAIVEQFIQRLVQVLRELQGAYRGLLLHLQGELNRVLLDEELPELADLRKAVAERYRDLDRYTPDRMGVGALIRRLVDTSYPSDEAWLESVATLLGRMPPHKWREEIRLQAELRLHEMGEQLRDLEKLRMAMPNGKSVRGALLVKMIDAERGEISRVINLSSAQRASAAVNAEKIAQGLAGLDTSVRLAVVAALLERFSDNQNTGGDQHE